MKIFVIGAGQVGSSVVEALRGEHDVIVIDLDPGRLAAFSYRYDVVTVEGNGASRRTLRNAGIDDVDLLLACTSRDEVNIVSSMFAKKLSPETMTIVRTTNVEYLEIWRERELEIDFMVSSELEAAHAISRIIGVPAARQTDVFADGLVQMVEFDVDVEPRAGNASANLPLTEATRRAAEQHDGVIGRPLREADIPTESKVASIIRGDRVIVPRGNEAILPGDRVVIIGSPQAARDWSRIMTRGRRAVDDVVIFGAGQTGVAVARALIDQGIDIRLVEADAARAREVAEDLPKARVFHATGTDPDFLERERIGQAEAAIFAMREDAKNLYAAMLAKVQGVPFTIALVHEPASAKVFEAAGIDVAVNPRTVTAEEMVRFAHDPRIRQLAMLEGDRFEVLDITVREESELAGKRFRDLPMTGSLIGAIIRGGEAIFPHGDDMLEPGDRAIIFTESSRVHRVEQVL
ncbi:MAG: Trk system potassium transporter TrkA [Actinomycetota bacterium]|nr:Trk system potassium transporter TrkA [Actinomycetota bacterium]